MRRHKPSQIGMPASGPAARYCWRCVDDAFELTDGGDFSPIVAMLAPVTDGWEGTLYVNGQRYVGRRPTQEEAFKALATVMYQKAKEIWLQMDSHAVQEAWAGTLPE